MRKNTAGLARQTGALRDKTGPFDFGLPNRLYLTVQSWAAVTTISFPLHSRPNKIKLKIPHNLLPKQ